MEFVPQQIYEERIKICKSCPRYVTSIYLCAECNCLMTLKARMVENPITGIRIECPHPGGPKWLKYEIISKNNSSTSN